MTHVIYHTSLFVMQTIHKKYNALFGLKDNSSVFCNLTVCHNLMSAIIVPQKVKPMIITLLIFIHMKSCCSSEPGRDRRNILFQINLLLLGISVNFKSSILFLYLSLYNIWFSYFNIYRGN